MVTAMWYVLRPGIPRRDLSRRFGPWSSAYTRFRRWCASGFWAIILAELGRAAFGRIRCVDCSHIKVHWDGANSIGGQAWQAMGRTKVGLNTNLAAVVDGVGRAVGLNLAPGQQHDLRACEPLETRLHGRWAVADKAFDSNGLRHRLAESGAMACIPPKKRTAHCLSLRPPPLCAPTHDRKLLCPHQTPPSDRHSLREAGRHLPRLRPVRHGARLAHARGLKTRPGQSLGAGRFPGPSSL